MAGPTHRSRLERARTPRGELARTLSLGGAAWRLAGLDAELARALDRRWGPFVSSGDRPGAAAVEVVDAGAGGLLVAERGEHYRLEPLAGDGPGVVSYAFAAASAGAAGWRLAIVRDGIEPAERSVENALRWLVARWATEAGGIALHGAGVERHGRGWIFAGPSNAGKSTAVGLSGDVRSLGDDFGVVLPAGDGFRVVPVPFDNSERIDAPPPAGDVPLAGVLRLRKAETHALRRLSGGRGAAAVAACAAFPWALPDLAGAMLASATAVERAGLCFDLEFARDAGFWELLDDVD